MASPINEENEKGDKDYKPHGIVGRMAIKPPPEKHARRSKRFEADVIIFIYLLVFNVFLAGVRIHTFCAEIAYFDTLLFIFFCALRQISKFFSYLTFIFYSVLLYFQALINIRLMCCFSVNVENLYNI